MLAKYDEFLLWYTSCEQGQLPGDNSQRQRETMLKSWGTSSAVIGPAVRSPITDASKLLLLPAQPLASPIVT